MTTANQKSLGLKIAYRSDVGLVRSENQDYALVSHAEAAVAERGRLLVVADGMGGHRGGATASRLAATTIETKFLHGDEANDVRAALRKAFEQANATIFQEAQINPDLRGMGTTTSAVVVRDGQAYVAHVGDSRVYLVHEGSIRQLTDDHSLVASMVREGLLTTTEAEVHPRRNVLQRSMGVSEVVEVDVLPPVDVAYGDTFILCSDGLHGLVREPEIEEIAKLSVEDAVREYIRRALERGAPDNVTVVVARVEEASEDHIVHPDQTTTERMATPATLTAPMPVMDATADAPATPVASPGLPVRWFVVVLLLAGIAAAAFFLLGDRS
jgi:PPM family protein phosphatase